MFEHLLEVIEEEKKYREKPEELARSVKRAAERILGRARVYLFGSVVEGEDTPSSDVDVMVVSEAVPSSVGERSKVIARILEEVGLDAPVEVHLLRPEDERWYLRFVKRRVEV